MQGLKIRVMTNKIFISMMKSLDASPTPMAFGELYSAMQQGTVDGQENPSAHIWTKRFFEVQKYASKTAHAYSPEPLVMSMISWSASSPLRKTRNTGILLQKQEKSRLSKLTVNCSRKPPSRCTKNSHPLSARRTLTESTL